MSSFAGRSRAAEIRRHIGRASAEITYLYGAGILDDDQYETMLSWVGKDTDLLDVKEDGGCPLCGEPGTDYYLDDDETATNKATNEVNDASVWGDIEQLDSFAHRHTNDIIESPDSLSSFIKSVPKSNDKRNQAYDSAKRPGIVGKTPPGMARRSDVTSPSKPSRIIPPSASPANENHHRGPTHKTSTSNTLPAVSHKENNSPGKTDDALATKNNKSKNPQDIQREFYEKVHGAVTLDEKANSQSHGNISTTNKSDDNSKLTRPGLSLTQHGSRFVEIVQGQK